jgi:hypothetical protein
MKAWTERMERIRGEAMKRKRRWASERRSGGGAVKRNSVKICVSKKK